MESSVIFAQLHLAGVVKSDPLQGTLERLDVLIKFTSASLKLNLVASVERPLPLFSMLSVSNLFCWPCDHQ